MSQFTNWRLIPHIVTTIGGIAPTQGLGSYLPLLVIGMGYDPLDANALISIGVWLLVFATLLWGYLSLVSPMAVPVSQWTTALTFDSSRDKFKIPGRLVSLGLLLYWGFTVCKSHYS